MCLDECSIDLIGYLATFGDFDVTSQCPLANIAVRVALDLRRPGLASPSGGLHLGGVLDEGSQGVQRLVQPLEVVIAQVDRERAAEDFEVPLCDIAPFGAVDVVDPRSEEHTSELQSRENLVCRLLLEKKNT